MKKIFILLLCIFLLNSISISETVEDVLYVGMKKDEVGALWGRPEEVIKYNDSFCRYSKDVKNPRLRL